MKKFLISIMAVLFVCTMISCGKKDDNATKETSKTESNEAQKVENGQKTEKTDEPQATKSNEAQSETAKAEATKQSDSPQNAKNSANLYLPNANVDGFDIVPVEVKKCPDDLVNMLVEMDALPKGSKILSFKLDEKKKTAALDMSKEYGDKIFQMGTSGEYMLVGSLVNTFIKYYDLQNITLKVDGKDLESGHNVYDVPIEFYEDQIGVE